MAKPVDFDNAERAAAELKKRAAWVKQAGVMVDTALATAQHRDTLRYARARSGAYVQRLQRFLPGDFVYVRKPGTKALGAPNLQQLPQDKVLKVLEVRTGGVIRLIGKDAQTQDVQVTQLAPCHLLGIDDTIDATLQRPRRDLACTGCNHPDREEQMLLCDACRAGWHTDCLTPPLQGIPEGEWYCPTCKGRAKHSNLMGLAPVTVDKVEGAWFMDAGSTKQGGIATRYARIKRVAPLSTARPFELAYENGEVKRVATRVVMKGVMPLGLKPPNAQCCVAEKEVELPDILDYSTEEATRKVLQALMPGHWHIGYAHALMAAAQGMHMIAPTNATSQLQWLFRSIDVSCSTGITVTGIDHSEEVVQALMEHAGHATVTTLTTSEARWHIHPGPYRAAAAKGMLDVVVAVPSTHVADAIVAMGGLHAKTAVMALVPITYISHAPAARYQYLGQWRSQHRLALVMAEPVKPGATQHVWLCMFQQAKIKARMCRQRECMISLVEFDE